MESLPLVFLEHQIDHKPKQEVIVSYTFEDLLLEVVCSLNRNEQIPRLVSNGIHMKTRPKNLQRKGVKSKLGANQDWSQ